MSYELFIALRYLRAKRRQTAVSVITGIAVAGIALGVAALIVAQAMIAGFRSDVQEKILQGTAHLNLLREDNGGIEDYRLLIDKLRLIPGVSQASATIYAPVLLTISDRQEQVIIKGVDMSAPKEASEVFTTTIEGDPSLIRDAEPPEHIKETGDEEPQAPPPNGIILGKYLAAALGVKVGDRVTAISATSRLTPAGIQARPLYTRFRVVGLFSSGLHEYDSKWAYSSLQAAQRLSGSGDSAGVIQMKVADLYEVDQLADQVRRSAGTGFITTTWQELNRPLFAALKLQHRVIIIFFALLIAIAALNIITTLTMMVVEKNRDIAILRAQGATPANIRRIFIYQGCIIGTIGSFMGLLLGTGLCWIANSYRLISIPAEIYSISYITLRMSPLDSLGIVLLAMAISLLATIYPSRIASALAPVEALRYE